MASEGVLKETPKSILLMSPEELQSLAESGQMPPELEALQSLKFSTGSPLERARSYREEGNEFFGKKKYKDSIISYSEGIRILITALNPRPDDDPDDMGSVTRESILDPLATLFSNRAAAHFHLGNYRTCGLDCKSALKFNPSHLKASLKCAESMLKLEKYGETIAFCDSSLQVHPDNPTLLSIRSKATQLLDSERKRTEAESEKKQVRENRQNALLVAIAARGIRLHRPSELNGEGQRALIAGFMPQNEEAEATVAQSAADPVRLDAQTGALFWPVLLLYPQHRQSDLVQAFDERDTFQVQLSVILEEPPIWDRERLYNVGNIEIFVHSPPNIYYRIQLGETLLKALTREGVVVRDGTPSIIVLLKRELSAFTRRFISQYHCKD